MTRALITINSLEDRQVAARWAAKVPLGTRIEFKASKRSYSQNAKMWALLTDLARQLRWNGKKLTADDWKIVMMDGLKHESNVVPNIHGTGFVDLGRSSADLSKDEMSQLIELILAFGSQHGVKFKGESA